MSVQTSLRSILGTTGLPAFNVGKLGDLATDPATDKLYIKGPNGWEFKRQGFVRQFSSIEGGDYEIIPGDPLLPPIVIGGIDYGSTEYHLQVDSTGATGTFLSWTFPSKFRDGVTTVPGTGPNHGTVHWPAFSLQLQRSPTDNQMPYGEANPIHISINTQLPATIPVTPDWATFKQWTGLTVDQFPLAWQDTDVPNHIWNYRLVMQMGPFNVGGFGVAEVDWNVVTVTKPYHFTLKQVQPDGLHLAWV